MSFWRLAFWSKSSLWRAKVDAMIAISMLKMTIWVIKVEPMKYNMQSVFSTLISAFD